MQPGALRRQRVRCVLLPRRSRMSPGPGIYPSRNPPAPLLFLASIISKVSRLEAAGYNTCPRAEAFYSRTRPRCTFAQNIRGVERANQIINDGDDQIRNLRLARNHRG